MTQDINLNDTDESPTETTHRFPKSDDPAKTFFDLDEFGPTEVKMPNGTIETVDPDYDVIVAVDPAEFYEDAGTNNGHRIEVRTDETDHSTIMDAIEYGLDYGLSNPHAPEDPMLTKVYLRDVFDEKQLCIEITAPRRDGQLSVLAANIRESCANRLA